MDKTPAITNLGCQKQSNLNFQGILHYHTPKLVLLLLECHEQENFADVLQQQEQSNQVAEWSYCHLYDGMCEGGEGVREVVVVEEEEHSFQLVNRETYFERELHWVNLSIYFLGKIHECTKNFGKGKGVAVRELTY